MDELTHLGCRGVSPNLAPPFPDQPQASAGLVDKMNRRPSMVRKAMVGSGTLPGRSTLGDTEIGSAAAIAFARQGATWPSAISRMRKRTTNEVIRLIEAGGQKGPVANFLG